MSFNFGSLFGEFLGAVCEEATGRHAVIRRLPFRIGPGQDFEPSGKGWGQGVIAVVEDGGRARIEAETDETAFWILGEPVTVWYVQEGEVCQLMVGGCNLMFYWGKQSKGWLKTVGSEPSAPVSKGSTVASEPLPARETYGEGEEAVTTPANPGDFTCPHCWLPFELGDVKHISVHEDLRGDAILGREAQQRFHAVRFNHLGQALDAMGVPCHEMACPHCHHKLHPGFVELPHQIYSIVGAPSAGKSYFLAAMIGEVQERMARRFQVALKDADPTGNATLNDMKARLFGAGTPEDAVLLKTQLDGEMYQQVMRHGHLVGMPRPFIFTLVHPRRGATHGLIFYDNAGEHFEPGMGLDEQPGAQHVAHSEAILFLFDPTANRAFRRKLEGHPDPQLMMEDRLNQQDVLLAEMDHRLRALTGRRSQERLDRPLLFLVGKSDVWMSMFLEMIPQGWQETENPDGSLNVSAVVSNSSSLRQFLNSVCPQIVAIAEGIAEEVVYFPVSSFGHSPLVLEDGQLAPDPGRLKPQGVGDPVLWALGRLPGWEFLAVQEEP
ncbi:MAG: hypothetical protein OHK005_00290 [Candidatus Methylacidiphilales bacterium]